MARPVNQAAVNRALSSSKLKSQGRIAMNMGSGGGRAKNRIALGNKNPYGVSRRTSMVANRLRKGVSSSASASRSRSRSRRAKLQARDARGRFK